MSKLKNSNLHTDPATRWTESNNTITASQLKQKLIGIVSQLYKLFEPLDVLSDRARTDNWFTMNNTANTQEM